MSENHEVDYLLGTIRELAMALEILRGCCEHSEGKEPEDEECLARGMSIGITVLQRHRHLVEGYQTADYWIELGKLRDRLEKERIERLRGSKHEEDGHGR